MRQSKEAALKLEQKQNQRMNRSRAPSEDSDEGRRKSQEIINEIEKGLMWRKKKHGKEDGIDDDQAMDISTDPKEGDGGMKGSETKASRFKGLKTVLKDPAMMHKKQMSG